MRPTPRVALGLVRVATAGMMVIHGVTRCALGTVGDFGGFLAASGVPLGVPLAFLLTAVEIAGGLALAAGVLVRPLCAWFIAELLAGVALVHASAGWFVVGAGAGGSEYSALLVVNLAALLLAGSGRVQE